MYVCTYLLPPTQTPFETHFDRVRILDEAPPKIACSFLRFLQFWDLVWRWEFCRFCGQIRGLGGFGGMCRLPGWQTGNIIAYASILIHFKGMYGIYSHPYYAIWCGLYGVSLSMSMVWHGIYDMYASVPIHIYGLALMVWYGRVWYGMVWYLMCASCFGVA